MAGFKFKRIQDLARQLLLGPAEVRRRQVDRLEELLLGLDPDRTYPYEFLYFRITGFRPKEDRRDSYPGREVLPDLLRLLEKLSRTVPRHVRKAEERVYADEEVGQALNVSTRTVRRWRRRGLVGSAYRFADGRTRIGVRQAALDRFVEANRDWLERSGRFTRLTAAQEARIVRLARRCAEAEGLSLSAAAARIAEGLGRARETIRLALLRHDREHPERAIFAPPLERLQRERRRRICADFRRGTPMGALCERYGRSRSSLYRLINQERAAEILRETPTFYQEDDFAEADADDRILGTELRELMARAEELDTRDGAALPRPAGRSSALSRDEEDALFRAYNYAKFRASELHGELNPNRYVASRLIRRIEDLRSLAESVRDCLVRAHLPLVRRVARQHASAAIGEEELLAEGRSLLSRLVASFDYRRRARFPRHANLELLKRFARTIAERQGAGLGP